MTDQKTMTTTLIRTIYSDNMSYIVMKFCNTSLSFQFVPFVRKDEQGKNVFDQLKAQTTTINWDSAFAFYKFGQDIISNQITDGTIQVNGNNSLLTIEHHSTPHETIFSLSKNGTTIPFKFSTTQATVQDATGLRKQIIIDSGLGAFIKTMDGYLTGINADRHLNKLTDDYVKSLEQLPEPQPKFQQSQPKYQQSQQKKWTPNPQWKQQPKYNYQSAQPVSWETNTNQSQQSLSTYKIQK